MMNSVLDRAMARAADLLALGGPAMIAIALPSVLVLAIILWKLAALALDGAFTGGAGCGPFWPRG